MTIKISVEGSHAIGKSKFAKELAEELGMVHVDFPRMDDICINTYGYDLRKISHLVPERLRPYDEKDLSRNPLGPVPGSADRFFITLLHMKLINHIMSIRHILNTGKYFDLLPESFASPSNDNMISICNET